MVPENEFTLLATVVVVGVIVVVEIPSGLQLFVWLIN